MSSQTKVYSPLIRWRDFRLKIFAEGILIGTMTGILIDIFRWILGKSEIFLGKFYLFLWARGIWAIAAWFAAMVLLGILLGFIGRLEPLAGGSGIPQVKGELLGRMNMNWLRVIVLKFIGGVLAIGAGLSLGREGPSVQLGASIGKGISRFFGRLRIEEKYLITSGASAGLAAAFNAPLAGVIFALEELHKNFSASVLTSAVAAALAADFVTGEVFGLKPIFSFHDLSVFPLKYYIYLIGLGIVIGVLGVLFNWFLLKTQDTYEKSFLPKLIWPVVPLIISVFLGFVLPQVLGGGNSLIDSLGQRNFAIATLFVLIVAKFLFTMISYSSGVPGGIFLPLLVIGALAGDLYGSLIIKVFPVDQHYLLNFIILAMAAYFSAIVKAPITGSILIMEMTGSFQHLLALITVSMTAYLVTDILKSEPIYDLLLERSLAKQQPVLVEENANPYNDKTKPKKKNKNKAITEVAVNLGSLLDGKKVKEIQWPENCLLVSIRRGETEIIPKGNTKILAGDYLYMLADESQIANVKCSLIEMAKEIG